MKTKEKSKGVTGISYTIFPHFLKKEGKFKFKK